MNLFDAHCHPVPTGARKTNSVVNGTSPEDWDSIGEQPHAAIGLHPWKIQGAESNWRDTFLEKCAAFQAIGEIGLDGLCGVEMDAQIDAFRWQLNQAAEHNLPVSIHCLKASEPLLRVLKESALPERGVHLHAYAGSADQVAAFVSLGAYFSFHAGQLDGNAKKAPEAIKAVPADRLMIETDAPDNLKTGETYENYLRRGYELAAKLRGESLESFSEQVAANFERYFLDD